MLEKEQLYNKIPKFVNQWNPNDVAKFLQLNHIIASQSKFIGKGIDGAKLRQLTPQILQTQLRISSRMVIKTIMEWITNQSQEFDQYVKNVSEKQNMEGRSKQVDSFLKESPRKAQLEGSKSQSQAKAQKQNLEVQIICSNKITEQQTQNRIKPALFFSRQLQLASENPLRQFQIFKKEPQYIKFIESQFPINSIKQNMRLFLKYNKKQYQIPYSVKLGRQNSNDIIFKDQSVSRFHAQIIDKQGKYYLKDTGSRFGTYYRSTKKNLLIQGQVYLIGSLQIEFSDLSINRKEISQFGSGSTFSCRVKTVNCQKVRSKYIQNKTQAILGDSHGKKQFPFDDQSIQNLHAKLILEDDTLFIQQINGEVMLKLPKQQQLLIKEDLQLKLGTCPVKLLLQEYCQKCKKSLLTCLCA